MKKMVRQGDVLLVLETELPATAKRVEVPGDKIVLAEGEATGHAHTVPTAFAQLFEDGSETYVKVEKATEITHQEHDPIKLDEGVWRRVRQREYTPRAPRMVAD